MGLLKKDVDYSLYLVTDSGLLSTTAKSFEDHVLELIEGGVTVVQLREKSLSTADFIRRGRQLLQITRPKGIPLIINDRVDVALAIDADGVHVGQDDMGILPTTVTEKRDLPTVRKLIGKDKIIGVSVNTIDEAKIALKEGADYLGTSFAGSALIMQESARFSIPLPKNSLRRFAVSEGYERSSS